MFDDHIIIPILLNFKFNLDRNQMWSNHSFWTDQRNLSLLQDFSFDLLNTSNHIVILFQVVCSSWKSERIWIHGFPRKNSLDQIISSEYFWGNHFMVSCSFLIKRSIRNKWDWVTNISWVEDYMIYLTVWEPRIVYTFRSRDEIMVHWAIDLVTCLRQYMIMA